MKVSRKVGWDIKNCLHNIDIVGAVDLELGMAHTIML